MGTAEGRGALSLYASEDRMSTKRELRSVATLPSSARQSSFLRQTRAGRLQHTTQRGDFIQVLRADCRLTSRQIVECWNLGIINGEI